MKFQITHLVPATENGKTVMTETILDVDFRADDPISAARRFKELAEKELGQRVTRTCIDAVTGTLIVDLESGEQYSLKGMAKATRPKMTKEERKEARESARKTRNASLISGLKGTVRPLEIKPQMMNGTAAKSTAPAPKPGTTAAASKPGSKK